VWDWDFDYPRQRVGYYASLLRCYFGWEWFLECDDFYWVARETDYTGPGIGAYRMVRGGSWGHSAESAQSAYRNIGQPGWPAFDRGFRLVRTVK
jgi:formylglycine-generating enzyme